jgi:hypothetical protein
MDLLLVTSPCVWVQQTDQSQEISKQRPKVTQVLHRIRIVSGIAHIPAHPSCNISIRFMDTLHTILCSYAIYW